MSALLWVGTTNGNAGTGSNFSTGSAPVTGNDLYIKTSSVAIDAGLNQSAVTLANLIVGMSMTGAIGTTSAYYQVNATNWVIGDAGGAAAASNGSGLWKIDFGSALFIGTVLNTASSSTQNGLEPLRIIGTHASNELYVIGGRVGVATTSPTETSTLSKFNVSGSAAVLNCGPGVTLTTGYQQSGTITLNSSITTFTQDGGTTTIQGIGTARTLSIAGTTYYNQRPAVKSSSGITRSSTTATATSSAHGYSNGDTVYISGANEANYNGYFVISNVAANTFDYTVSSTAPTPATGTITCVKATASVTGYDGGTLDLSQDGRDVYVAAITANPGFAIKVNSANPGHFHYGTLTVVGGGSIKVEP